MFSFSLSSRKKAKAAEQEENEESDGAFIHADSLHHRTNTQQNASRQTEVIGGDRGSHCWPTGGDNDPSTSQHLFPPLLVETIDQQQQHRDGPVCDEAKQQQQSRLNPLLPHHAIGRCEKSSVVREPPINGGDNSMSSSSVYAAALSSLFSSTSSSRGCGAAAAAAAAAKSKTPTLFDLTSPYPSPVETIAAAANNNHHHHHHHQSSESAPYHCSRYRTNTNNNNRDSEHDASVQTTRADTIIQSDCPLSTRTAVKKTEKDEKETIAPETVVYGGMTTTASARGSNAIYSPTPDANGLIISNKHSSGSALSFHHLESQTTAPESGVPKILVSPTAENNHYHNAYTAEEEGGSIPYRSTSPPSSTSSSTSFSVSSTSTVPLSSLSVSVTKNGFVTGDSGSISKHTTANNNCNHFIDNDGGRGGTKANTISQCTNSTSNGTNGTPPAAAAIFHLPTPPLMNQHSRVRSTTPPADTHPSGTVLSSAIVGGRGGSAASGGVGMGYGKPSRRGVSSSSGAVVLAAAAVAHNNNNNNNNNYSDNGNGNSSNVNSRTHGYTAAAVVHGIHNNNSNQNPMFTSAVCAVPIKSAHGINNQLPQSPAPGGNNNNLGSVKSFVRRFSLRQLYLHLVNPVFIRVSSAYSSLTSSPTATTMGKETDSPPFPQAVGTTMWPENNSSTSPTMVMTPMMPPLTAKEHKFYDEEAIDSGKIKKLVLWRELFTLATPTSLMIMVGFATQGMTVAFIGQRLGSEAIGLFSIGNSVFNLFGISIGFGLTAALDTLVSQSFGRFKQNSSEIGEYIQRATAINIILTIPVGLFFVFGEPVFNLMFGEEIGSGVASYTKHTIPYMLLYLIAETFIKVLQAIDEPQLPFLATLASAIACWFFNYYFMSGTFIAAAWIMTATYLVQVVALIAICFCHPRITFWRRSTWFRPRVIFEASAMREYMRIGVPSLLACIAEWWAFEVIQIIAAGISIKQVAALNIVMNVSGLLFSLSLGVCTAASVKVGNALGENKPALARRFAGVSIAFDQVMNLCTCTFLLTFKSWIGPLFTNEPEMLEEFSFLALILALYHWGDSTQIALQGVFRGVGKQGQAVAPVLFALWFVGLPLSYLFGRTFELGAGGIMVGLVIGFAVEVPLLVRCMFAWDWRPLAAEASRHSADANAAAATHSAQSFVNVTRKAATDEEESVFRVGFSDGFSLVDNNDHLLPLALLGDAVVSLGSPATD